MFTLALVFALVMCGAASAATPVTQHQSYQATTGETRTGWVTTIILLTTTNTCTNTGTNTGTGTNTTTTGTKISTGITTGPGIKL